MAITLKQYKDSDPAFANIPIDEFFNYMHQEYYSHVPEEEFAKAVDYVPPKPVVPEKEDFVRGFKEPFKQLPQQGYGLLAGAGAAAENTFGEGGYSTGLKKYAVDKYIDETNKLALDSKESDSLTFSLDKAKQGDYGSLVDWVQHGLGYGTGQLVELLATRGIGSAAARLGTPLVAKELTEKMVASQVAKLAAEEATKNLGQAELRKMAVANVGARLAQIGGNAAMVGSSIGMEGSEIMGGLTQKEQETGKPLTGSDIAKGFAWSVASGLTDFVGDKFGLDVVTGKSPLFKLAGQATGVKGMVSRGLLTGAIAAPAEGGQEYVQTLMEEQGKGNDPFSAQSLRQAFDASGMGAIAGGGAGIIGGVLSKPVTPPQAVLNSGSVDEAISNAQATVASPSVTVPMPVTDIQETQDAAGNRSNAERNITVTSPSGLAETSNTGAIGYDEIFNQAAVNHAIPVEILKAFNMVEAGGRLTDNGKTIRPLDKNGNKLSNAVGPMQIIGHYFPQFDADKLANDPQYNVNAAAQILQGYYANTPEKLSDIQRWRLVARKYFGSTDMAKNTEYANKIIAAIGKDSGYKDVLYQGQTLEQPEVTLSETITTNEETNQETGQEGLLSSPANFDYLSSEGIPLKKIGNVFKDYLGDEVIPDGYEKKANQSEVAQAIDELIARNNEEKQAETQTQEAEIGSDLSSSITGRGLTGTNDGGISTIPDRLPESDKSTIEPNVSNTISGLDALADKEIKQPWEMRHNEWNKSNIRDLTNEEVSNLTDVFKSGTADLNYGKLGNKTVYQSTDESGNAIGQWQELSKTGRKLLSTNEHKEQVKQALANGLPVPANVLSDYPELQAQYAPTPTSKESLQVQSSNGQATPPIQEIVPSAVTKDLTKITKVHAKVNSKGQNKLVDSGTGYEVFPDKEFKNITAERLYFKAEKAKQVAAYIPEQTSVKPYHPAIQSLADDLTIGGGIAYIFDANDNIKDRTSSVNPYWYKDGAFVVLNTKGNPDNISVKMVKDAVTAHVNKSKLTGKQERILRALSDTAESLEEAGKRGIPDDFTHEQKLVAIEVEKKIEDGEIDVEQLDGLAYELLGDTEEFTGQEAINALDDYFGVSNERETTTKGAGLLEEEALSSYTEDELQRKDAEDKRRKKSEQEAELKAKQKASADREIDTLADEMLGNFDSGDVFDVRKESDRPMGETVGMTQGSVMSTSTIKKGEEGNKLTKEQRKQVLKTLVDVYKSKGADKETRINSNGDEYTAFPHQPELFEKSDITGAMVRFYVTMPDGKIAHPTELFPDVTQSKIDAILAEQKHDEEIVKSEVKRITDKQFDSVRDAGIYWDEQSDKQLAKDGGKIRSIPWSLERTAYEKDGKIIMPYDGLLTGNPKIADELKAQGWNKYSHQSEQPKPVDKQPAATDKQKRDDTLKFSKAVPDNTLAIVHNLSLDNLIHADKMGGIAAPSLAVTDKSHPLEGFGEITLIGNKDTLGPQASAKNRYFNADVYSPRYPNVKYVISEKDFRNFIDSLSDNAKKLNAQVNRLSKSDIEDRGLIKGLEYDLVMQYEFLQSQGKAPAFKYKPKTKLPTAFNKFIAKASDFYFSREEDFRKAAVEEYNKTHIEFNKKFGNDEITDINSSEAYNIARNAGELVKKAYKEKTEGSSIDTYDLDKKVRSKINNQAYKKWLSDNYSNLISDEKIFNGYTYSGTRKYLPHNLDTVVRLLTKELRGGEGFNYGVPSIRAHVAKQFKTIKSIQDSRNDLVTKEQMEKLKEEVNAEFESISEELSQYRNENAGYSDQSSEALAGLASKGYREFKEYYTDVPTETMQKVVEFLDKLKHMPSEYFEAKIGRAVGINEFDGALVPIGKEYDSAIAILKKHGITEIKRYKANDNASRSAALKSFTDLLFSKATAQQPGITIAEAKAKLPKNVKPMLTNGKLKVLHNIGEVAQDVLNRGEVLYHAAWHGSPHEHNKFDSSKIGTGEGAQAFGYGHYFTDAKSIAEYYRDQLSSKIDLKLQDGTNVLDTARTYYGKNTAKKILNVKSIGEKNSGWKLSDIKKEIEGYKDRLLGKPDLEHDVGLLLDAIDNGEVELQKGKLYLVELAPTQDEYLDWDKPLSEQSELVKEIVGNINNDNGIVSVKINGEKVILAEYSSNDGADWFINRLEKGDEAFGEVLYRAISKTWSPNGVGGLGASMGKWAEQKASEELHSLGIRGIRYKAEQGKSSANNYVIFSDEDISITNKYSINAWHGGADFNQFNLDFVGTGRGTSHFGYGFNFSDLKELARDYVGRLGKLYNVDIAPNKSDLLDFDKPVSLQSEKVRTVLEANGLATDNRNGNRIYKDLVAKYGSDKEASTYLLNLGIKGTMHKLPGQTAYNYVAFSDKDVSILQKFATGTMGAEGLYDSKTDTLYLFADNLNNNNFNSVLSHELFHRSLATDKKTKSAYDKFLGELQARFNLAARGLGSKIENAAYKRVIKAKTKLVNQQEEFAAYIISEWQRAPKTLSAKIIKAIKNFVGAIRMALLRAGLDFGTIGKLHPSDLLAMAGYGAQSNVNIGASFNSEATVMASAKDQGYEGNNKGEAFEWLRAKAKGLDMSQEARMARAKMMGFDVNKKWFHGGDFDIDEFNNNTYRGNLGSVYLTDNAEVVASSYALYGAVETRFGLKVTDQEDIIDLGNEALDKFNRSATVYPLYVKANNKLDVERISGSDIIKTFGKDAVYEIVKYDSAMSEYGDPDELSADDFSEKELANFIDDEYIDENVRDLIEYDGASLEEASSGFRFLVVADKLNEYMDAHKYDSVLINDDPESGGNTLVIRQPNQIRSIHAAFDPDFADSGNLLASAPTERFYSALHRAILGDKIPKRAFDSAKSLQQWLNNTDNVGKIGVKPDEIFWSGINDFLDIKSDAKEKVTREELDAFMRESGTVRVVDIVLDDKKLPDDFYKIQRIADDNYFVKNKQGNIFSFRTETEANRWIDEQLINRTKYANSNYVVPGGKNAREIVVTIPTVDAYNASDSTHYGDIGTLAGKPELNGKQTMWMRLDDRTDADGNEGIFMNEGQSQRAQHGKTKGFQNKYKLENLEIRKEYFDKANPNNYGYTVFDKMSNKSVSQSFFNEKDAESHLSSIANKYLGIGPAPAPFITDRNNKASTTYITLLLKKAVSLAIDEGKGFVAWTTGSQQAGFYDLSKQIRRVEWLPQTNTLRAFDLNGASVIDQVTEENKIEDYVGKEVAKKLLESAPTITGGGKKIHSVEGDGLKIEAPWTQAMYGSENGLDAQGKPSLFTQAANDIAKKFGGKVGSVEINTRDKQPIDSSTLEITEENGKFYVTDSTTTDKFSDEFNTYEEAKHAMYSTYGLGNLKQPALIITPSMAAKIRDEGFPLFSKTNMSNTSQWSGGDTITIDGKERPTRNSNGQLIAQTEEGLMNFWKWFDDSIVVDEKGRPLVVYHGTDKDFTEFDYDKLGESTLGNASTDGLAATSLLGYWFNSEPMVGKKHSPYSKDMPVYLKISEPINEEKVSYIADTLEGYLHDDLEEHYDNDLYNYLKDAVDSYKESNWGSDGIIIKKDEEFGGKSFIAFESNQIKSIDNIGDFNPDNNDIRYSIASEEENLPYETGVDKFQRQFQDKMIRFKVIQQAKEIESAKDEGYTGNDIHEARAYMKAHGIVNPIRDDTDVYQAESLRSGIATELIKDFEETVLQPLVKETVDSKLKMDDISDFLKMQHVEEANARIRKIKPNQDNPTAYGITDEEAQAYLDEVKDRDDYQELKRIAEKWRGLTDDILNMKVSNGIIPQEQADAYRATFNLYVPVKGAEETPQGTGRGLSVYNNNKRRLGHSLREERIVENIIKDYESTINLIEKNKVAIIAGNFIKEIDDNSIGTIGKPVRRQVFMPGAVHYMVEYHGSDVQAFDNLHDAQQFVNDESLKVGRNKRDFYIDHTHDDGRVILQVKPLLDDHEFQYYEDGKAIRGQWNDELLARAFKNLGIEPINKLLEGAREFNTFLSKAYTGWSPTFLIKNPIRDAIQGAITLTSKLGIKETGKIFAAYPHAMKELYNHFKNHGSSNEVNLYRGSGGSTGAAYISDTDRIGNDIMDSYNEYAGAVDTYNRTYEQAIANGDSENKAKLKAAMKAGKAGFRETPVLGHFINFMEKANSITENALRLATFNTLIAERENGKRVYTNAQAALMAKDLMNFNRKGELTTQLGALYLFFNPNAQGTHVLLSALGNSQYKNEARVLTGTIVLAAYLAAEAMRGGDDEDKWKRIPANLKDRNLIFGVGDTKFMLPVPYGYGIFHSLGNAISDVAHGQSGWKSGIRLVASMFDNFSPFGNPIDSEHGAFQLLPTIPKMAMATSVNENNFGSPIMPDKWNASKPDSQTMWRNTKGTVYDDVTQLMNNLSGGSKYKAGIIDVSPESLRFWVSSLTGGTGQFALDSINLGATTLQGATPDLKEIPIVKAFTHEIGVQDARQAFWTAADEAKTAADEFSAAKKAGDRYAMMDIKKSDGTLIALSKFAVKQQKMIKTLRDAQDLIRTSNLSLSAKKAKLKALERKEIAVYDKFLHSFYKENY